MTQGVVLGLALIVSTTFNEARAGSSYVEMITFYDLTDGTRVEEQYASKGVHFLNDYREPGGGFYRSSPTVIQTSLPARGNVLVNDAASEIHTSWGVPLVVRLDQEAEGVGVRLGCFPSCYGVVSATVSLFDCNGNLRAQRFATPAQDFSTALEVWDSTTEGKTRLVVIDYGPTTQEEAIDDLAIQFRSGGVVCADTKKPVVQITSHQDNQVVATSPINIEGTVTDNSGAIQAFMINAATAELTPHPTANGKPTYTFSYHMPLSEGGNPVTALAVDAAGNKGSHSITINYGPPVSASVTEFHITQRGLMKNKSCDIDDPFVAGKFTIVRIAMEAETSTGAPSYVSWVELNLYRKVGGLDSFLKSFQGTTYSQYVSTFNSSSELAGIHFWIPGEWVSTAGEYTMRFQPYVGLSPLGSEAEIPCATKYFTFDETKPVKLFIRPVEAPLFSPALSPEHVTYVMTELETLARSYPVRDGFSEWWETSRNTGLKYAYGAPLVVCDGSERMRDSTTYCNGTGFEWTFKDTHPSGIWRADHAHAVTAATTTVCDPTHPTIGGQIQSATLYQLQPPTTWGLFRPGGPPQWQAKKYVLPFDDNHNGSIVDDMPNYIGEFRDVESRTWSTNLVNYSTNEVFRSFVDLNGNNCFDKATELNHNLLPPAVNRWYNIVDHILWGRALESMKLFNQGLPAGSLKMENASLWFPEDFHPQNGEFGMFGPGTGELNGKQTWIRPRNDNSLTHEVGHNFGLNHVPDNDRFLAPWQAYVPYRSVAANQVIASMWGFVGQPDTRFFNAQNYQTLYNKLLVSTSPKPGKALQPVPALSVSGVVDSFGEVASVNVITTMSETFSEADPGSPYLLVVGSPRDILTEHRFPVHFPADYDGEPFDFSSAGFDVVLPLSEEATWVEIVREGEPIYHLDKSASAPFVEVLAPNHGESFGPYDDVVIEWNAWDEDGDALTCSVHYSPDNGARWHPLADGITTGSYLWNTGSSPGGQEAFVMVRASDGWNVGEDQCDLVLSVGGKPPVAAILSPQPGSAFLQWEHIPLEASAIDPEGSTLSVFWDVYGDAGGADAYSLSELLDPLPAGSYTAELSVIDDQGLHADPSTTFTVIADSDKDGMADEYEDAHGLHPGYAMDATWDLDEDGLSSFEEARYNTDPNDSDTDDDGWSDGEEIAAGSDPRDENSTPLGTPTPTPTFTFVPPATHTPFPTTTPMATSTVTTTPEVTATPGGAYIDFTVVPPYGSGGMLHGVAGGVPDVAAYKVAVCIFVGDGWWTKPAFAEPCTFIEPDGSWACDIGIAEFDPFATRIAAFLLPMESPCPLVEGFSFLPEELFTESAARIEIERGPEPCPAINFAGYEWTVKNSPDVPVGPGPNFFSCDTVQVEMDTLYLGIAQAGDKWLCSEVILNEPLGYGRYLFHTRGRVDSIDPCMVIGLFTWDPWAPDANFREMDIEISKWCDADDPNNAQFVVQPWDFEGNRVRFPIELTDQDNDLTFVMCWQPEGVTFAAYRHHHFEVPPEHDLIFAWTRLGEGVPAPGEERIRINFWLASGNPPIGGTGGEFAVTHFGFSPECAVEVPVPGDFNGDGAVTELDLLGLVRAYHTDDVHYDLKEDGLIDSGDLYMFSLWWQRTRAN